jgi:hypothetical protein
VALAAGVAGGWVLFEREDEDDEVAGWNTCTNPLMGFSIDYPAAWYTDHLTPEAACLRFDPRQFELQHEGPLTALQVSIDPSPENPASEPTTFERVERDTAVYGYRVPDDGEREFLVLTSNNAGVDFDAWKAVVDQAVRTLRFGPRIVMPVEGRATPPLQTGLPEVVARKRSEVWKAAGEGDYDQLARLVDPAGFEYTFGGPHPGGPAGYWRELDQDTPAQPLETLEAILELPYTYDEQSKFYVWPFAFTRKASSLTPGEKEQLAQALGDDALKLYEQSDNYLGYRTAIDLDGNWVFYVAGD